VRQAYLLGPTYYSVQTEEQLRTHDVMVEHLCNSTSSVSVSTSSALVANTPPVQTTDPLICVIVILGLVVVGAIIFVICGLLQKAEAHLHSGRETTSGDLLVDHSPTAD